MMAIHVSPVFFYINRYKLHTFSCFIYSLKNSANIKQSVADKIFIKNETKVLHSVHKTRKSFIYDINVVYGYIKKFICFIKK